MLQGPGGHTGLCHAPPEMALSGSRDNEMRNETVSAARRKRVWVSAFSCCLALSFLAGCGEAGGERCSVKGSITLNGVPIETGTIVFEPQGQGGARGGASIKNGEYEIPIEREMWAGSFVVRVTGFRETGRTRAPFETLEGEVAEQTVVLEELVPRQYNSRSTLDVELASGENEQDFELIGERKRIRR